MEKFVTSNIDYVDELIIVDDGSLNPIDNFVKPSDKLKLYRVGSDIGFNSHGCRNLIMSQASNNWVVMIDIDRCFKDPSYAFDSIRKRQLLTKARYLFIVHVPQWGHGIHPSVNDYLIHKDHFFSAGGYDEEIVGQRWGDRQYFEQLLTAGGTELIMHDIDIMHTRKSTSTLKPNSLLLSSNRPASHVDLIQQRINNPTKNKPTLQFEWDQLF